VLTISIPAITHKICKSPAGKLSKIQPAKTRCLVSLNQMIGEQVESQEQRFRKAFSRPYSSPLRLTQAKSSQELGGSPFWLE
jgi:hypothetical protein